MHGSMSSAAPSGPDRVAQPAAAVDGASSAEQLATRSNLKLGDASADRRINKQPVARCSKGQKRQRPMPGNENMDGNIGGGKRRMTAYTSWDEREMAANELGVLDARKMLGQELPTRTAGKSALKQKVWALLRLGIGCTFKHISHAEDVRASSQCAHAVRGFPSRREAECYLKAGTAVLEAAKTTEINKLVRASRAQT